MSNGIRIAIDGPAGAGKSTVAKLVAEKLGYLYVDTGAMYRAVTLQALLDNINLKDEAALTDIANNADIILDIDETGNTKVLINHQDVTKAIRTPQVSHHVSLVAQMPGVRAAMSQLQRKMAQQGGVVVEGRDVGTYLLPQAELKIFLSASVAKRADRRWADLHQSGFNHSYEQVVQDIIQRDTIDTNRAVAPLKPAPDAIIIDSSDLTAEQVANLILSKMPGGLV